MKPFTRCGQVKCLCLFLPAPSCFITQGLRGPSGMESFCFLASHPPPGGSLTVAPLSTPLPSSALLRCVLGLPHAHVWAWRGNMSSTFSPLYLSCGISRSRWWDSRSDVGMGEGPEPKKGQRALPAWAPQHPPYMPLGFFSLIPTIWGPPRNWQTPVGHIWFKRKKQGVGRPN